jgi:hypothetical protein
MRRGKVDAGHAGDMREGLDVLARRRAFEAVKDHQPARARQACLQVDVDEVVVGRGPALAHEARRLAGISA